MVRWLDAPPTSTAKCAEEDEDDHHDEDDQQDAHCCTTFLSTNQVRLPLQRSDCVVEERMHRLRDVDRPGMGWGAPGIDDHPNPARMRVPRLHRRALVGRREVGQDRITRVDIRQVTVYDLFLVAFSAGTKIAAHRVDRLPARSARERRGANAVFVGEGWTGEVDARHLSRVRA